MSALQQVLLAGSKLPIEFVGASSGYSSMSLPTHQAGDMVVCFAFYDGSSIPTAPPGFTSLYSGINSGSGIRLSYFMAIDAFTTLGSFGGACVVQIYRNVSGIGSLALANGISDTVTYPALTVGGGASSFILGFVGHRLTSSTIERPPYGMSNRAGFLDAYNEVAGHNATGITSWPDTTVYVSASGGWQCVTVELLN